MKMEINRRTNRDVTVGYYGNKVGVYLKKGYTWFFITDNVISLPVMAEGMEHPMGADLKNPVLPGDSITLTF